MGGRRNRAMLVGDHFVVWLVSYSSGSTVTIVRSGGQEV